MSKNCLRAQSSTILVAAIGVAVLMGFAACTTNPSATEKARIAAATAVAAVEQNQPNRSGAQPKSGRTAQVEGGVPQWVVQYPVDPANFVGVGNAPDTGDPSADIATAQKNARNALATSIATTIRSETTINTSETNGGHAQQSASILINERVDLKLEGVQLVDSYHSKKEGYWFYYRLSRTALDPQSAVAVGVGELLGTIEGPTTLAFAAITYSDSGLSSAFSAYLRDQILISLRSDNQISISAKPAVTITNSTGAAVKKPDIGGNGVKSTAAARLTLTGTFFGGTRGKVSVFLELIDQEKETIVGESSFALDTSLLPPGLSVPPVNFATAVAAKNAVVQAGELQGSTLRVRLWPEHGDGATYLDGQDLVLNFTANQDCYIKMYHIDVNGRVSLILPNQYSQDNFFRANRTYRIPPAGAPYQFQLGKPYGVEFIKVIASSRQFSDIERAFTDLGRASRSLVTRGLTVNGTGPVETAQAMASYTILGRK